MSASPSRQSHVSQAASARSWAPVIVLALLAAALLCPGSAPPASAASASVGLRVSPAVTLAGKAVTARGAVTPHLGRPVRLQRRVGGVWTVVRRTVTAADGS